MSVVNTRPPSRGSSRRAAIPPAAPELPAGDPILRKKMAREIAALVRLAELDAALLGTEGGQKPRSDEVADERHGLGAWISPEILEAYERALRGGRQPAVVRLLGSVCSGCHVRLHSKLDHVIRRRRGVAACPHCLRLVYDPSWLTS